MKILQLSLAYAPSWKNGGLSRIMFDYARDLAGRGHQVSVYTSDVSQTLKRRMPDWPKEIDVSYFKSLSGPLARFYFNYSPAELYRWLSANLPHVEDVARVGCRICYAFILCHRNRALFLWLCSFCHGRPRRSLEGTTLYAHSSLGEILAVTRKGVKRRWGGVKGWKKAF